MSEKAWLVRPSPHDQNRMEEFLDQKIVAVGWPLVGDLTGVERDGIKAILSGPPYNYRSLSLGNAYATIDIIVNQMQIGDYILVPNFDEIYFSKIDSGYVYDPSKDTNDEGYPHQRKVIWLSGPIPREQLPAALRKSLKVHRATANLSHHLEVIRSLAEGFEVEIANDNDVLLEDVVATYPLRPNYFVNITVPRDITSGEASRLADFVRTLHFED